MEPLDLSGLNLPEKEQKILEAAVTVFSKKGFSAATTSEIARNAGIAEGTIFRYFKTKKDILRGILIQTIHLMSGKLVMEPVGKILLENEDKDLRTALKELLYDRVKLVESIFPMVRVLVTEAIFHEDVREAIYQHIVVQAMDIFKVFHKRMVDRGMIRDNIEPEILARTILGNMFAYIGQRVLFNRNPAPSDIDQEFDKILDIVLYGISKKE